MSLAETAVLAVELKLGTTGSFKGATSELSGVERAAALGNRSVGALQGGFGVASRAAGSFGGALKNAGGHLKELITGPLGIIGLGGGLFALGGIFESSIHHASDMGLAVEKLTGLTGESATAMSGLIAVFERFGIANDRTAQIVGFTEKTLGKLTASGTKAIEFQNRYGVAITDANGKALPFTVVLNHLADYYNSSASASDKAAAAATIFGRGYAAMIPILKLGSQGIKDAEQAAADLGLTLTAENASALKNYRGALRDVGEAIGGLQLQIGLVLLPEVAKLATGLTSFLAHGGTQQVVGFFKNAAKFAEQLGGVIGGTVIPTISSLAGAASKIWSGIPPEFRDLLVKGFIADRTVKFLFGISPIKLAVDFAEGALSKIGGSIGGSIAAKVFDKAFVQPVFVTNPGFGGGGGIPGVAPAAAAGLSASTVAIAVAVPTILVGGALLSLNDISNKAGENLVLSKKGLTNAEITAKRYYEANKADQDRIGKQLFGKIPSAADYASALAKLGGVGGGSALLDRGGRQGGTAGPGDRLKDDANNPLRLAIASQLDINARILSVLKGLNKDTKPADVAEQLKRGLALFIGKGRGDATTTKSFISDLQTQLGRTHDPKLQAALREGIALLEKKLPGREYREAQLHKADKIVKGTESTAEKVKDLTAIQRDLKAHGMPVQAKTVEAKIDALKRDAVYATRATTEAIKDKDLSTNITVPITNKVVVNSREIASAQATFHNYFVTGDHNR